MADLTMTGQSDYPDVLDTATAVSDKVTEILARHINGLAAAVLALEAELGVSLRGSAASLAARLSVLLADDGALRAGTDFPPNPIDGQLFWRADLGQLFIFRGTTGQWQRVDSTNDHGSLGGLLDDDHPIYALANGAREIAGNLTVRQNVRFKSGTPFLGTIDHAISADRTWFLPDRTDELVARLAPQALSNKTLDATNTAPYLCLRRSEGQAENPNVLSLGAQATVLLSVDLGQVQAGDRVLVTAVIGGVTKDISAGTINFQVLRSNGSSAQAETNAAGQGLIMRFDDVPINGFRAASASGVFRVTGAGLLTLVLVGSATPNFATVDAGQAYLHALTLRGT